VKRKLFRASRKFPQTISARTRSSERLRREETHIGVGALHGVLIVGATLAGYDPTPENTAKLICLTREEERAAKAALHGNRRN
jgi:hypothetical protein